MSKNNPKKLHRVLSPHTGDYNIYDNDNRSRFYCSEEELALRKFVDLHKNIPTMRGAFNRCRNLGLVSKYDLRNLEKYLPNTMWSIVSCSMLLVVSNFISNVGSKKIPNNTFIKIGVVANMALACYHGSLYMYHIKKLDKKYSCVFHFSKASKRSSLPK